MKTVFNNVYRSDVFEAALSRTGFYGRQIKLLEIKEMSIDILSLGPML
jgi:hypothetical protein